MWYIVIGWFEHPYNMPYGISKSSSLSLVLGTWKICREGLPLVLGALAVTLLAWDTFISYKWCNAIQEVIKAPWMCIVSVKARSDLHRGHFFNRPSSPLYRLSAHLSHPRILLQQRVNVTGGWIGLEWHTLHLNVSWSNVCRPGGSFMPLLNCTDIFSDSFDF